ncbi:Filaggrin [Frankliniella fusca]|uniref:Filaggrin n=1 Tax=Frankliniella fusca TaxID=407009 RepID=A0AAE1GYD7_9NEOP|nr:Filaggrin [Frankliniella fusca]
MTFYYCDEEPSECYNNEISLGNGLAITVNQQELDHLMSEYYLQYDPKDVEMSTALKHQKKPQSDKSFWLDSVNARVDYKEHHVEINFENLKMTFLHPEFQRLFFNGGKKVISSIPIHLDSIEVEASTSTCSSSKFKEVVPTEVMDEDEDSASLVDTDSEEDTRSDGNGKEEKPSEGKNSNAESTNKNSKKHVKERKPKKESSEGNKKEKRKKDKSEGSESEGHSSKEDQPKKKKKRSSKSKDKKPEHDSDEGNSSDEEITKINCAASKIPTYKSIKNLTKFQFYKVLDVQEVETTKGRTIRLRLEDHDEEQVQKRKNARDRQRNRRSKFSENKKRKENQKSKVSMKSTRDRKTRAEKDRDRKLNSERRRVSRMNKKFLDTYSVDGKLDVEQHNFSCYMKSLVWKKCNECHKRVIQSVYKKYKCGPSCYYFTEENDMDPLAVPDELKNLTYIEKQLICKVHSVVSLYRFKKAQYKYRGQVINFSQNVQSVADSLPHLVAALNNVVVVKLTDKLQLPDFVVRKNVVLNALLWLKENNPNYFDLKIDYEKLNYLPDNGNVYDELNSIKSECDNDKEDDNEDAEDPGSFNVTYSDVPDVNQPSLRKSGDNILIWPSIGKTPVNEFSSPGYLSMAFPHLFCYGIADYSMPRMYKVSLSDYIKHLMLYSDGRFAQDERFRYFLMNSEMRWTALNVGNIYVQKHSIFSKMTIIQLKMFLKENPSVVNQIMNFGSRLRTTKSYWSSRCGELLDIVNQLGTPTIFFTLSSADYHWPDLYRLLGYDVKTLTVQEKADLISKNPLVADSFFYARYEFQHRGSIHVHGIAWFENGVSITDNMSETEKKRVIDFYDSIISCENPNIKITPSLTHPCQLQLDEIEDMESDLCHLVNFVQRHTKCRKTHCLRLQHNKKKYECRYGFPKDLCESSFIEEENTIVKDINFKRNDGKDIVYRYIAKYTSKCEVKSHSYNEILVEIMNKNTEESEPCKKAIRKLLISSCGERDYCAQEVTHFLMGYKFYHSSREFIVLNLRNLDWVSVSYGYGSKSIVDLYIVRPDSLSELSLFELRPCKEFNENEFYNYMSQIFYPWRSLCDVEVVDDNIRSHIDLCMEKFIHTVRADDEDDDDPDKDNFVPQDNESILSGFNPNSNSDCSLGFRTCDTTYKWDKLSNLIQKDTVQILNDKLKLEVRRVLLTLSDLPATLQRCPISQRHFNVVRSPSDASTLSDVLFGARREHEV